MPRRPRVVIPGVAHHVTQRGNNRQQVFFSPGDYRFYLELLMRHSKHAKVHILGYCLMTNHVHIVAVPEKEDGLARLVGRLQSEYALAANRTVDRTGHLWQSRFFSCPLDEGHLIAALRYVDLNPVRAGLVKQASDWPWSSVSPHLAPNHRDLVLDPHWQNWVRHWSYAEWQDLLAATLECDPEIIRLATHTGVPLGSREFVARLESRTGRRLQPRPRGRPGKMVADPIFVDSSTGVY